MNAKFLLATLAIAAAASGAAQAQEGADSQYALKFEGQRTRAEVAAEAATVSATRNTDHSSARGIRVKSTADVQAVRAQAAEALRLGKIPAGELRS